MADDDGQAGQLAPELGLAACAAGVVAAVAASDCLPWLVRRRPVELGLAPDAARGIDLDRG